MSHDTPRRRRLTPEERKAAKNARHRAWSAKNRERIAAYARKRRAEHPEINKRTTLWRQANPERAKLSRERQDAKRVRDQEVIAGRPRPDICDICAKPQPRIVFDHSHQHGHFRGWLCDRCNTILGWAEDDAQLLLAMVAYLRRTKENVSPQLTLPGI